MWILIKSINNPLRRWTFSSKKHLKLLSLFVDRFSKGAKVKLFNRRGKDKATQILNGSMKGMIMCRAKDIMTKKVICVYKDTPIFDVIQIMVDNSITGVPVVEEDMTLVGMLSEQDVLRLFHTYKEEMNRKAGDFMTQPAVHFDENDRLLDICYRLRDYSIRRVPVTSNGKVTGIISRADILKRIMQLSQQACPVGSE